MKKRILILSIFSVCLIVNLSPAFAKNNTVGENIAIITDFRMEILNDGKLTENKMLVELRIVNVDGDHNIFVDWNHVYINPVHETKTVILKAQHFSTSEGSIRNVIANNNNFSFVIDLSGTYLGSGRTVQVVGNRRPGSITEYDIEATALWWSDILNKKIKTEWRSTDKKFLLPYKEVFTITKQSTTLSKDKLGGEALVKQKAASSNETSTEGVNIIFIGFPKKKISEGGLDRIVEDLTREKATDPRCVISKIEDKYYWASRENVEMVKNESGAFIIFHAVNGSGYVKVIKPELKKAVSLMSKTEESFDYFEHLSIGLRSVNYWGKKER